MQRVKQARTLKKEIAKERVIRLLASAKHFSSLNTPLYSKLSRRQCLLAEKVRKAVNLRLPKSQKMQYCKKCFSYWVPGRSVKVVVNHSNKLIIYRCMSCGAERKFGFGSAEQNARTKMRNTKQDGHGQTQTVRTGKTAHRR